MGGAAYPRGAVATRFRLRLMNALLYAPISDMQVFWTAASFCEENAARWKHLSLRTQTTDSDTAVYKTR